LTVSILFERTDRQTDTQTVALTHVQTGGNSIC